MSSQKKNRDPSNQSLSEDVIWGNVHSDDYEDIPLAPLDPDDERRRPRQRESMLTVGVVYEEEEETPFTPQFTIKHLIIAQTGIAVLLGVIKFFAIGPAFLPKWLAGMLGIASMIFAALLTIHQPEEKHVHYVWWAMFGLYLLTCLLAFVVG